MKKGLLVLLGVLMFLACKKDQNLQKVNETIYVRSNGADMPVYLHGNFASGTIILLVHGGPGGSSHDYRSGNYAEALESIYGMAYWDQRGQGMSQGRYKKDDVTIEQMVIDMRAVINSLKTKYGNSVKIFALGHSWGGTLTAQYMITKDYQYLLNGWIESNGAHDIPKLNRDAVSKYIGEANRQIALGNHVSDWENILSWATAIDTNNITETQSGEINSKARDVEEWLTEDGFIQSPASGGIKYRYVSGSSNLLVSVITGLQTSSKLIKSGIEEIALTDQLYKVEIPTLVLWGEYDFVVPPSLGYDCYNTINSQNKQLVIFPMSGHSPMSNEWEDYVEAIKTFVESVK